MLTTIDRPTDHGQWLAARRPYFNASAAGALYRLHPFLSLARIVADKLDPPTSDHENRAMRRGRHLEPAVADWWAEEHDVELVEPPVMYVGAPLAATLDRLIVGRDGEAVEVKTTADVVDEPARYWWWQVQAQMHCADLARVHLAVLDATMTLKSFTVARDDGAIADLVDRAAAIIDPVSRGEWPAHVAGRDLQLPRRAHRTDPLTRRH